MKVTYNWLKEFVRFNYSPQELADHLTMLGLEVEVVVPVKLFFSGVVVGKILEVKPHPSSPKLLLCKVTIGKEDLQVVCGAHNISVGDLVPTAVIGATLADNTKITKRNILGVDSFGMLCTERELGFSDMADGIFILPGEKTLKIGAPLEDTLGLKDTVLDINVTPNRSDALSVIGIAREISSITGNPLKSPKIYFAESGTLTNELVEVKVKSTRLCPRYTARVIRDVKIGPSPFWMRYRLGLLGVRPINNVVDITNYVLMELGQPLHAFDYNAISDNRIIVRTAVPSEEIITIDNEKRVLNKDVLVIADTKRPIAIAGVMGGKGTEVGDKTKDILIESAYFDPVNIRRTSKRFGLITESSYRFERALDPELAPIASNRAAQLILKIAGGSASKKIADFKKDIPKPPLIKMDSSYPSRIIGIDIPIPKINAILNGLGCKTKRARDTINVRPPSWRRDITKKIDLVEEISRLFGYTKIPPAMPNAKVQAPSAQKINELIKRLYALLTGMGLNEIITYSFINPTDADTLRILEQKYLRLINPVDKDVCAMRTTLIPDIINTIVYNLNMKNESVHIFELGRCFLQGKEELSLGIGVTGPSVNFFYIKGILEELFRKLFIKNYEFPKIENPAFHPGKACGIKVAGKEIGLFGEIQPQIIKQQIYITELNVTLLAESITEHPRFQPLPRFPSVRRDISIILDKNTESYDIINVVKGIGSDLIESVEIFDVYEGEPIPPGKKSIAYAITYRHGERTLTDEEVDNIHNTVRHKILENVPNANFRE